MTDHACLNCTMLRRRMDGLRARNRRLEQELQKERAMHARVQQQLIELQQARRPTASNSSIAPSANPIGARPAVVKKPTGRKPGGQIGHQGKSRTLLPLEQVHEVIEHRPPVCGHCQSVIQADAPGEVVGRHQVAELPPVVVVIREHQSLACRCGRCGQVTRGAIPAEIVASVTGPRLSAAIGILGASVKGSKRDVAMLLGEVLSSPMAIGSVCAREREIGNALAGVYQDLVEQAAGSKVKYVDETSWKLKGKEIWLWVSAGQAVVVYRIDRWRSRGALKTLFGGRRLAGVFCTDRAGVYDKLRKRGLCWAHLKRDFVALVERGGAGEAAGLKMLEISRLVFELWHRFKSKEINRRGLIQGIEPLRQRMRQALEEGSACGQKKTVGLCRHLLKREAGLWRFAHTPGLEPTNNLAERMLRPAVIWRKKCFGSSSEAGCRYVERVLSVTQTLRLRGQNMLEYLAAAIAAHRRGEAPPAINGSPYQAAKLPAADPPLVDTEMRKVA